MNEWNHGFCNGGEFKAECYQHLCSLVEVVRVYKLEWL